MRAPLSLVLDTNVVLDLLHFADPAARPLLAALHSGRAIACATPAMHAEFERVLAYPQLKVAESARAPLAAAYRQWVRTVDAPPPAGNLPRCRDADDQMFIELAAAIGADLLVSKDKAVLQLRRQPGLPFLILPPPAAADWLAAQG